MSFFSPPAGLVAWYSFGVCEHVRPATDWSAGGYLRCEPDEPYNGYTIRTSDTSMRSLAVSLGDVAWFTTPGEAIDDINDAPYWVVQVRLTGPAEFSYWTDPEACFTEPPFDYESAGPNVDATLSAGSASTSKSYHGPSDSDADGYVHSWFVEGNLVNPAPVWPSPDFEGNTFGSLLFAPDQIPSASAEITVQTGPNITNVTGARLALTLFPYQLAENPPPLSDARYVAYVGAA